MLKPGAPLPVKEITTITGEEHLTSEVTGCPRLQESPGLVFVASNVSNRRSQIAIALCGHYQEGSCRADGDRGPCKLDGTGWAYRQGDSIEKTSLRIIEPVEAKIRVLRPDPGSTGSIDAATQAALLEQMHQIATQNPRPLSYPHLPPPDKLWV
jgi:hypothetical protein